VIQIDHHICSKFHEISRVEFYHAHAMFQLQRTLFRFDGSDVWNDPEVSLHCDFNNRHTNGAIEAR